MDLPTYTNIWRIEKRLYKLYDFRLPMPLPVGTFGVAIGVFLIWVVLLSILNAPFAFGNGWHLVLWVVPPGVITVLATRPVIEGKRLTELLISQARFLTEPRVMTRLAPEYEPGELRVSGRVWHRHPDAGPLPMPGRRSAEGEHGAAVAGEHVEHDAAGATADVVVPDAPPLRGVAGRAQAEAVHAEPWEELYTPAEGARRAEPADAAESGHAAADHPAADHAHAESAGRPEGAATEVSAGPAEAAEPTERGGLRNRGADGAVGRPHPPETVHGAAGSHDVQEHEDGPTRATGPRAPESAESSRSQEPSGDSDPSGPGARERERVPAFAAAGPAREATGRERQPSAVHDGYQESEPEPRAFTRASADPGPAGDGRSVGRKVLNYFGFALASGPADPSGGDGGQGSGRGRGSGGGDGSDGFEDAGDDASFGRSEDEGRGRENGQGDSVGQDDFDGFDDPVFVTEEDEDRDRDAWFASLRASSGHTPVGLTSKGAYTGSDTGPMSSEELAEAAGSREESAPARRLRGRIQGIQVTRELDGRRNESERLEAAAPEREQEGRQGHEQERGSARGRAPEPAPERRRARAQGQALPPETSESQTHCARGGDGQAAGAAGTAMPGAPEQTAGAEQAPAPKRRPHAAPWELDRGHRTQKGREARRNAPGSRDGGGARGDLPDLSDYAARFAEATGRPTTEAYQVPWLPPASGAPAESGEDTEHGPAPGRATEDRADGAGATDRGAPDTHGAHNAPAVDPASVEESAPSGHFAAACGGTATLDEGPGAPGTDAQADTSGGTSAGASADADPGVGSVDGPDAAAAARPKPSLQLDHGTGEHDAMPRREHEDPDAHGPEWNEHMSVLDHHLSKADTPAPPRPKFADAVPGGEREPEQTEAAAWFDDGGRRHPDQPRAGDRGNPVISARELRERERVRDRSEEDGSERDALELDDRQQEQAGADGGSTGTGTAGTAEQEQADADSTGAGTSAPKPPTQLDHGTGELASFSEVKGEQAHSAPSSAADSAAGTAAGSASAAVSGPDTPHRRTADELERAEAEALEERRRLAARKRSDGERIPGTEAGPGTGTEAEEAKDRDTGPSQASDSGRTSEAFGGSDRSTDPGTATGPGNRTGTGPDAEEHSRHSGAPASHPRANPSLAALARDHGPDEYRDPPEHIGSGADASGTDGDTAQATEESAGTPSTDRAPDPDTAGDAHDGRHDDAHDGVFHRVANNARRLGRLFGQPAPGEEPDPATERDGKPELELDHGTGEQERLGDTPNGVPAQRPARDAGPEADPAERPESGGTRGWRRLARVVTGGASPVRSDLPPSDIERLRTPLAGPRNLVVLGCTGGAGQTVTALMVGHTLAAHRDDRVVAVDVNPGPNGLSRRVGAQTPETLTALLANADGVQEYEQMRSYASRANTGLEVVQTLDDPYVQTLDDRDYGQLADLLGGFYGLTLMDPAATGVSRALPGADGLVLVAPASADAERAVSMTFEWLDGNGYSALRANSVLVVNGVSKRSLPDVDAAERVARGRCRAIVRVPWDDHLGASYTRIDVGALRSATKRAHGALGGVLVRGLAD